MRRLYSLPCLASALLAVSVALTPLNAAAVGLVGAGTAIGNAQANIQLVGGSGSVSYRSTVCVVVTNQGSGICVVIKIGTYNSIVCGTGTLALNGSISGAISAPVTFNATYLAGIGVVTGSIGGSTLAGAILISLAAPPTVGTCGQSFNTVAAVAFAG